uniref:DDE Tnp4 domain-containing protein n=1 Tax=Amphimedon queenslandica TaxID=400682 RepID=A0A1X7U5E0_AMPQE
MECRWRLFRRTIIANPENIVSFTKAAVVLHNYLRKTECVSYCPPGFVDGEDGVGNVNEGSWRSDSDSGNSLLPLQLSTSNRFVCVISHAPN